MTKEEIEKLCEEINLDMGSVALVGEIRGGELYFSEEKNGEWPKPVTLIIDDFDNDRPDPDERVFKLKDTGVGPVEDGYYKRDDEVFRRTVWEA